MIIDVWVQHPTLRHAQDSMFDSLRRWTKQPTPTEELPVAATIAMADQANIDLTLISAWYAPESIMISNDEVAEFVQQARTRLLGVGSVDIRKPMQVAENEKSRKLLKSKPIKFTTKCV